MRIVINVCHGGFGLSPEASAKIEELNGRSAFFYETEADYVHGISLIVKCLNIHEKLPLFNKVMTNKKFEIGHRLSNDDFDKYVISHNDIERNCPILLKVVEELGKEANGRFSDLKIVEIPDGVDWEIKEYDGWEHIAEKHRTWR